MGFGERTVEASVTVIMLPPKVVTLYVNDHLLFMGMNGVVTRIDGPIWPHRPPPSH